MIRRVRGFTLIELLVAVSISVAIVLLATNLWHTSLVTNQRLTVSLTQREAVRDALRIVEDAWQRRTGVYFAVSNGNPVFSVEAGVGELPIKSFECVSEDESKLISLKVAGLREPPRTSTEFPPRESLEFPAEVLLRELTSCSFGYLFPPTSNASLAKWVTDWEKDRPPPALIRLDLATSHGALPPFIFSARAPL